jgi:hypothetical protein
MRRSQEPAWTGCGAAPEGVRARSCESSPGRFGSGFSSALRTYNRAVLRHTIAAVAVCVDFLPDVLARRRVGCRARWWPSARERRLRAPRSRRCSGPPSWTRRRHGAVADSRTTSTRGSPTWTRTSAWRPRGSSPRTASASAAFRGHERARPAVVAAATDHARPDEGPSSSPSVRARQEAAGVSRSGRGIAGADSPTCSLTEDG